VFRIAIGIAKNRFKGKSDNEQCCFLSSRKLGGRPRLGVDYIGALAGSQGASLWGSALITILGGRVTLPLIGTLKGPN
jgi:hypothetical protein